MSLDMVVKSRKTVPWTYMSAFGVQSEVDPKTLTKVACHQASYIKKVESLRMSLECRMREMRQDATRLRKSMLSYKQDLRMHAKKKKQEKLKGENLRNQDSDMERSTNELLASTDETESADKADSQKASLIKEESQYKAPAVRNLSSLILDDNSSHQLHDDKSGDLSGSNLMKRKTSPKPAESCPNYVNNYISSLKCLSGVGKENTSPNLDDQNSRQVSSVSPIQDYNASKSMKDDLEQTLMNNDLSNQRKHPKNDRKLSFMSLIRLQQHASEKMRRKFFDSIKRADDYDNEKNERMKVSVSMITTEKQSGSLRGPWKSMPEIKVGSIKRKSVLETNPVTIIEPSSLETKSPTYVSTTRIHSNTTPMKSNKSSEKSMTSTGQAHRKPSVIWINKDVPTMQRQNKNLNAFQASNGDSRTPASPNGLNLLEGKVVARRRQSILIIDQNALTTAADIDISRRLEEERAEALREKEAHAHSGWTNSLAKIRQCHHLGRVDATFPA